MTALSKAPIVVGEYYTARVQQERPVRKIVERHVRVIRAIEGHEQPDMWLVESSFADEQYEVDGSAMKPESTQLRESRLEQERLWGTKWVKKGGAEG